ncbi:MAG TPA: aminoacyl-tRNA hydrolase [Burkholderiales bacterium]
MIKLVVGLGNPGKEYAHTRHNAGFWWVQHLAERLNIGLRLEARYHGWVGRGATQSGDLWLQLPDTFMNASGRAVAALARFYKIQPAEILVVHDELDLPPGQAKMKQGGGNGGHNGLKDIAAVMGSHDFWRLRLGIGHPGVREAVVGYVLQKPSLDDLALIQQAMERGLEVWPWIERGDFATATMKLHTTVKTNGLKGEA